MGAKESNAKKLARWRKTMNFSHTDFCDGLEVSRQGYYNWLGGAEISLKYLSQLAVDHVGEWQGAVAIELIENIDPAFVPCACQTSSLDNGPCPRHSPRWEMVPQVGMLVNLRSVRERAGVEA